MMAADVERQETDHMGELLLARLLDQLVSQAGVGGEVLDPVLRRYCLAHPASSILQALVNVVS